MIAIIATSTAIEIACAGATSESAPEGVVSQVSIEQGWRLVSGEYDRHESGWRVNDEFTSEGAFASASFFGDYDLGATVSGSPTTVVEFGVAAYDAAGNYDACTFFLGILPEEGERPCSRVCSNLKHVHSDVTQSSALLSLLPKFTMCCGRVE